MSKTYRMYERLKDEIKAAGLRQSDIAEYIGVYPSNFCKMLFGKGGTGYRAHISLEQACAIQERFFPDISVNELFVTKEYEG